MPRAGASILRQLIDLWLDKAHVSNDVQVDSDGPGVELCQLSGVSDRVLLILNHHETSQQVRLRVRGNGMHFADLLRDSEIQPAATGDWQSVSLALEPESAAVLHVWS